MEWLRWYHGAISDDKWPLIARKSGQPVAIVIAIWAALLECASQADDRGSIDAFDPESVDALLQLEDGTAQAVVDAMEAKGLLEEGRIANWNKYRSCPDCRKLDVPTNEWAVLRMTVFQRDNFTCQYCGKRGARLECDHVFPFSLGGKSTLENLVAACVSCNRSKGAKTLSEWRQ